MKRPVWLASLCAAFTLACGGSSSTVGPADAAAARDAAPDGSGAYGGDFVSNVEGVWVVGWVGNLNHLSWVRFDPLAAGGHADYLPGTNIPANAPYWSCTGAGSWGLSQKPNTVMLSFPASCNLPSQALTFDSITAHIGYPNGALLDATLSLNPPGQPLQGWKFPSSQCDAPMTTCMNPF